LGATVLEGLKSTRRTSYSQEKKELNGGRGINGSGQRESENMMPGNSGVVTKNSPSAQREGRPRGEMEEEKTGIGIIRERQQGGSRGKKHTVISTGTWAKVKDDERRQNWREMRWGGKRERKKGKEEWAGKVRNRESTTLHLQAARASNGRLIRNKTASRQGLNRGKRAIANKRIAVIVHDA